MGQLPNNSKKYRLIQRETKMKRKNADSAQSHSEEGKNLNEPFLFRFAQPCISPARVQTRSDYIYDEAADLVRWLGAAHQPPAIEMAGENGPTTKKCDIEKGDDNKDRRMWQ